MIGGYDIVFEIRRMDKSAQSNRKAITESVCKIVKWTWPTYCMHGNNDKLFTSENWWCNIDAIIEGREFGMTELFFYDSQNSYDLWEEKGWNRKAANGMIYVLFKGKEMTVVVNNPKHKATKKIITDIQAILEELV